MMEKYEFVMILFLYINNSILCFNVTWNNCNYVSVCVQTGSEGVLHNLILVVWPGGLRGLALGN